jgi:hypothetical protein
MLCRDLMSGRLSLRRRRAAGGAVSSSVPSASLSAGEQAGGPEHELGIHAELPDKR